MKIQDLPDEERRFMRMIIREYCTVNKLYAKAHKLGIGLEATEEAIERLVNAEKLYIVYDEEDKKYYIKLKGVE